MAIRYGICELQMTEEILRSYPGRVSAEKAVLPLDATLDLLVYGALPSAATKTLLNEVYEKQKGKPADPARAAPVKWFLITKSMLANIVNGDGALYTSLNGLVTTIDPAGGSGEDNMFVPVSLTFRNGQRARYDIDASKVFAATIADWNGATSRRGEYEKIFNKLAQAIGRNVVVDVPHSCLTAPFDCLSEFSSTQPVKLHIWSAVIDGDDRAQLLTAGERDNIGRGIAAACRTFINSEEGKTLQGDICTDAIRTSYSIDSLGLPLFILGADATCGIGSVSRSDIFIYYDAVHWDGTRSVALLDKILQQAAILYPTCPSINVGSEIPIEEQRKLYVAAIAGRFAREEASMTSTLTTLRTEVDSHQRELVAKLREAEKISTALCTITRQRELELAGKSPREIEFDRISRNPNIASVLMRPGKMVIHTKDIYCVDPRSEKEHHIGKFRITIDTKTSLIRFLNMAFKVDGMNRAMQAPHVFPDGRPCLGSMEEVIPVLIGNCRYADAAEMAVAFLGTVNVQDPAGRHINKWPFSEKQKAIDKAIRKAKREEEAARHAEAIAALPPSVDPATGVDFTAIAVVDSTGIPVATSA